MKTNKEEPRPLFGSESRFRVTPVPAVPFRATEETTFERLKARLLRKELAQAGNPEVYQWVRRAANEAAALAWLSNVPLLVFPDLFEERLRAVELQLLRQSEIRERSLELLAA